MTFNEWFEKYQNILCGPDMVKNKEAARAIFEDTQDIVFEEDEEERPWIPEGGTLTFEQEEFQKKPAIPERTEFHPDNLYPAEEEADAGIEPDHILEGRPDDRAEKAIDLFGLDEDEKDEDTSS